MQRKLTQNIKISVTQNSKAQSKSLRKKKKEKKKSQSIGKLFLFFSGILLHQRVYYLHQG